MKARCILFLSGLLLAVSCKERPVVITVVGIGDTRIEIAKQVGIINRFAPKVVGLDFFLGPDSLDVDTLLVRELAKLPNTVQIVRLHGHLEFFEMWDSLETSHPKFPITGHGFANVTTLDSDTSFVEELPMHQRIADSIVSSFSYVIAEKSFGVKERYQNRGLEHVEIDIENFRNGIKVITKEDLASGNFNREDLDGKVVLMGYLGPDEDLFLVDDDKDEKINGVLIQAAIINKIMDF